MTSRCRAGAHCCNPRSPSPAPRRRAACSRAAGAFAQGGFDWKRFKGEKIEITLQKSPFHDVLQKYEPEFTALTGIEVGSEQIPEQQYRQKLAIEFASGKPSFDACYVAQATQKRLFGRASGWPTCGR